MRAVVCLTLSALLLGCQPASDPVARAMVAKLEDHNQALVAQIQDLNQQMLTMQKEGPQQQDLVTRIAELENSMKDFAENYDTEMRAQLKENIETLETQLDGLSQTAESSRSLLADAMKLQAEIRMLRDACRKHELEAADANLAGQVKDTLQTLLQDFNKVQNTVDELERSIGHSQISPDVGSQLRTLKRDVRLLESKVRRLR